MSSELWQHKIYMANVDYIFGSLITEYDISKANISVLRDLGRIGEDDYNRLLVMPKIQREITIGCMQRDDQSLSVALKDGITEARRLFFTANDIQDYNVLSIKNDSITLVNKQAHIQQVSERIFFKIDGGYTNFIKLANKEIYYFFNRISGEEIIKVKGIGDYSLGLHKNYMLEFIAALLQAITIETPDSVIGMINSFYDAYINRNCAVGYYRRFDALSRYDIIRELSGYSQFQADMLGEDQKGMVDIFYNEGLLRQLLKIFSSYYFMRTPLPYFKKG